MTSEYGTGNQTTTYVYGTSLSDSSVASTQLLRAIIYPDSTNTAAWTSLANVFTNGSGGYNRVQLEYNALGEVSQRQDNNQTVHSYTYDTLGRLVNDRITSFGTGVDQTVKRISRSYEVRGMVTSVISFNNATVGSGSVLNDDELLYNAFGQLASDQQSHSGAVNTSTSPITQYAYDDGSSNEIRPTSVTYPNGRVVDYLYNADTISNNLNRVTTISNDSDSSVIASYAYQGLNHVQTETYPTPNVRLDYTGSSSGTFTGWDNFDRVACQDWINSNTGGTPFDVFKITHGYDQDSNRLYADNQVQLGSSKAYAYDSLNRLTASQDGNLNSTNTAAAPGSFPSSIGYTLDVLGNQTGHSVAESTSADSATFDTANKLATRNAKGTLRPTSFTDSFNGSVSPSPWTAVGSGDTYTTGTSGLTVTGRTTYGSGTSAESRFILLLPQDSGPFTAELSTNPPSGATTGEYGLVFGYKSINDYWTIVQDISTNYEVIYHVVDGIKSLVAEGGGVMAIRCTATSIGDEFWSYTFPDGFPSGRIGLFSTIAGMNFPQISFWSNNSHLDVAGRWDNFAADLPHYDGTSFTPAVNAFDQSTGGLRLEGDTRPILLKGLRAAAGQATFSVQVNGGNPSTLSFLFGAEDIDRADRVDLLWGLDDSGNGVYGYQKDGSGLTLSSLDGPPVQTVNPDVGDTMWVRVSWFDGGITWVNRLINDTGTPTEDDWSSCTDFMEFNSPSDAGGLLGFELLGGSSDIGDNAAWDGFTINNLTVKSLNSDATVNKTEVVEPFTLDTSGNAEDTFTSDANGNQTYDGTQAYTYDAWNRLMTVAHAYRDSTGVHSGQTLDTIAYDGRGRRISKAVSNTGNWDCTYNYYFDGDSVIEERNGSGETIKQFVWGARYIDELIQTSINSAPSSQTTCDTPYWALQDANWNVLGVVDATGVLHERYEYSPYGQRTVFYTPGSNDPYCMSPTIGSQRVVTGGYTQPYGICEVGHQGLFHDEESGLVYDRARYVNPATGRMLSRDHRYFDGMNLYQYCASSPTECVDPKGLWRNYFGGQPPSYFAQSHTLSKDCDGKTRVCFQFSQTVNPVFGDAYDVPMGEHCFDVPPEAVGKLLGSISAGVDLANQQQSADDLVAAYEQEEAALAQAALAAATAGVGEVGVVAGDAEMTADQQALKDLVDEATNGGRTPLSVDDANTVNQWAQETNYPGFRAGPGDVSSPSNWPGGDYQPHIHLNIGGGVSHIPVEPGVTPVSP